MLSKSSQFLTANHVSKNVQSGDSEISILRDINLEVEKGESIAILGPSGSGKTTLLTLLAGLDTPSSGDIFFLQQHINQLNEDERSLVRAQYIGFIFQSFQLLPAYTALENVMLPLELQYVPQYEAKEQATEWLNRVGLGKRLHHYPTKLSGGEQQRVGIARAFVSPRKMIFADEMTGNLDIQTGKMIADILFSLNQHSQTTIVLVTHDAELAARCHRRFQLSEGLLNAC